MDNAILVQEFIDQIWNKRAFEKLDRFLHPGFRDYSLPAVFSQDKQGLIQWIINTGVSFEHNTIIEDQVTEGEKSVVKIRMNLKHIGKWRNIEPTGIILHTVGFRHFKISDGKIIAHWALIDGQAIENQLKNATHGCLLT